MSHFLVKARNCCILRTLSPKTNLGFAFRWFSISAEQKQAFTVSYLVDSLGLTSKDAESVSKRVAFINSEKPLKTIGMLKDYGFTQTQISTLVRRFPKIFVCEPEKIVLPKLEFLKKIGLSVPEITRILSIFPSILGASLEKRIMPAYEFLRNFFGSDERLVIVVRRCPDMLIHEAEKYLKPNIDILRDHGVSDYNIGCMIKNKPRIVLLSSDQFLVTVKQVVEMGFDPSKGNFISAVTVLRSINKSIWERKVVVYQKWGWTEGDILEAFKRNPLSMKISENKIMAGLNFFMNELGWDNQYIVKNPYFLGLSLKKRVKPRYLVYKALLSKDLVKEDISLPVLFKTAEPEFLRKYIACHYKDVASELLKLYKDKAGLSSGSDSDSE